MRAMSNAERPFISDPSFAITRVRAGQEPAIICIDGFLTEGEDTSQAWLSNLPADFSTHAVYVVTWESKCLKDVARLVSGITAQAAYHFGFQGMKSGNPIVSGLSLISSLVSNPWSEACDKAKFAGWRLARILAERPAKSILVGHSLGARVIYFCLDELYRMKAGQQSLEAVYLLGGAVNNTHDAGARMFDVISRGLLSGVTSRLVTTETNWAGLKSLISGPIFNCYSENDSVLKYLYNTSQFFMGDSVGQNSIEGHGFTNVDVSHLIDGHRAYKPNLADVMTHAYKVNQQEISATQNVV